MSKIISLQDAVKLIRKGDKVGISGNMAMSPMSLVRQIVREGIRDLQLLCSASCSINADLLIGAGLVKSIELPHISLDEYGVARNFRSNVEEGNIEFLDHV